MCSWDGFEHVLQYMHHCLFVKCVVSDVVMISLRMNRNCVCALLYMFFLSDVCSNKSKNVMRAVCCRYVNDVLF